MSQNKIYELMKQNPIIKYEAKELSEKLNIGRASISTSLRTLIKFKIIKVEINKKKKKYLYSLNK